MKTRSAFTLIELLVVVAIIVVLIALMLPSLNKARQQARLVTCMSNVRQLGTATFLYLQDNNDWFPPPYDTAKNNLSWYVGGLLGQNGSGEQKWQNYFGTQVAGMRTKFHCPASRAMMTPTGGASAAFGYGMNSTLGGGIYVAARQTKLDNPMQVILYADCNISDTGGFNGVIGYDPPWLATPTSIWMPNTLHGGAANYLMVDLHVESLKSSQSDQLNSGPVGLGKEVFFQYAKNR